MKQMSVAERKRRLEAVIASTSINVARFKAHYGDESVAAAKAQSHLDRHIADLAELRTRKELPA